MHLYFFHIHLQRVAIKVCVPSLKRIEKQCYFRIYWTRLRGAASEKSVHLNFFFYLFIIRHVFK